MQLFPNKIDYNNIPAGETIDACLAKEFRVSILNYGTWSISKLFVIFEHSVFIRVPLWSSWK